LEAHHTDLEMSAIDREASNLSAGTTQIWIESVKRPDGRTWYTERNGL
jgi:hypothetical protein